jgi:hypothetical protein
VVGRAKWVTSSTEDERGGVSEGFGKGFEGSLGEDRNSNDRALVFTKGFVAIKKPREVNIASSFSLSFWILRQGSCDEENRWECIIETLVQQKRLGLLKTRFASFSIDDKGLSSTLASSPTPVERSFDMDRGKWYFVTYRYNAESKAITLLVDGVPTLQTAFLPQTSFLTQQIKDIDNRYIDPKAFSGEVLNMSLSGGSVSLSDIFFVRTALSDQEVCQIYRLMMESYLACRMIIPQEEKAVAARKPFEFLKSKQINVTYYPFCADMFSDSSNTTSHMFSGDFDVAEGRFGNHKGALALKNSRVILKEKKAFYPLGSFTVGFWVFGQSVDKSSNKTHVHFKISRAKKLSFDKLINFPFLDIYYNNSSLSIHFVKNKKNISNTFSFDNSGRWSHVVYTYNPEKKEHGLFLNGQEVFWSSIEPLRNPVFKKEEYQYPENLKGFLKNGETLSTAIVLEGGEEGQARMSDFFTFPNPLTSEQAKALYQETRRGM